MAGSNGSLSAFKSKVLGFVRRNSKLHDEYSRKFKDHYLGLPSWSPDDLAARQAVARDIASDRRRLGINDDQYDAILNEAIAALHEELKDDEQVCQ